MELSLPEVNFVKIARIILNIVPKYLRECFIKTWNKKYRKNKWKSNAISGAFLFSKLPNEVQRGESRKEEAEKLRTGIESNWDVTLLVYVMLDARLKLIEGCRPKNNRELPLRMSEEIEIIREIRNSVYGHAASMTCQINEFNDTMLKLKSVARNIFGEHAENEFEDIGNAQMGISMQEEIKAHLKGEFIRLRGDIF